MACKQQKTVEIEDLGISHLSVTNIYRDCDQATTEKFVQALLKKIADGTISDKSSWTKTKTALTREFHISPGTVQLNYAYYSLLNAGTIKSNATFRSLATAKSVRSESGVIVVTVLTSPFPNGQPFSCRFNCYYCPDYPNMPRSYVPDEPAVKRGERNGWDSIEQTWDRLSALFLNGHPIDKLEILVLGGTWDSYPVSYQDEFVRDLYYAANTFFEDRTNRRKPIDLDTETNINQTAVVRVIGLTLETRPDQINSESMIRYRRYNCTRVQLGIQSLDDRILKKINRECYREESIRAIWNLKNNGFKVDIHIMPDLPGSTPDGDREMFDEFLESDDFQADQWKIYPCETTPHTVIEKWMDSGKYIHYSDEDLQDVIIEVKTKVHPWIRLNRVIRDIPTTEILDGNPYPNLRQMLHQKMAKLGLKCNCMRCREVKSQKAALEIIDQAELVVREYQSSGGTEYFISFESPDRQYLYGFCRLRLSPHGGYSRDKPCPKDRKGELRHVEEKTVLAQPVLKNTALIRELHVYGKVTPVKSTRQDGTQHYGFGRRLMAKAEEIALKHDYQRIAVISGVGVRQYYNKIGYHLEATYMIKTVDKSAFEDAMSVIKNILGF